ncbi:MAG: hypothetical protein AAF386_04200, partial [Pseudomonadota bacterium]
EIALHPSGGMGFAPILASISSVHVNQSEKGKSFPAQQAALPDLVQKPGLTLADLKKRIAGQWVSRFL